MAQNKKLKIQPDKVRLLSDIELLRLPPGYMDIPTLNWEMEALSDGNESDSEEEVEFEPTGKWRQVPGWHKRSQASALTEGGVLGAYATGGGGGGGEEEEEDEDDLDWSITADWSKDRKPGPLSPEVQRFVDLEKVPSCMSRLESFVGKSYGQIMVGGGGKDKDKEREAVSGMEDQKPPVFRPWWDHEPMAGVPVPRFIWQVESETSLSGDRQIKVIKFQDNSVFQSEFRVLRKNKTTYQDVEETESVGEDIEELLSLDVLETIRPLFNNGPLSMGEYKAAIAGALGLADDQNSFPKSLSDLFTQIDTFSTDKIAWDDLCDFLQQQYAEKAETEYSSPPVAIYPPCTIFETPHRGPITRAFTLADKGLLCFSEDGVVSLWTSSFKPRIWRALGRPATLKNLTNISDKKSSKWFTDIVHLPRLSKFLVPTGERELQFYDTATYDPYCQVVQLYSVPIHVDAKLTSNMQLIVVMGDISGCVSVIIVDQAISTLRNWSQQHRINSVPTIAIHEAVGLGLGVKYAKFKVHDDMISSIYYCTSMNRVVSSSINQHRSLIMGSLLTTWNANEMMEAMTTHFVEGVTDLAMRPKSRKSADEIIFPISNGCRTFDIWEEKRWLAAGGLDRLVWVWNMYVPSQPIAKLKGHNAALYKVIFDQRSETLFSICTEKTIRVWQLLTNTCIHTLDVKSSKIKGPILHCFFPTTDGILIQTNDDCQYLRIIRSGDEPIEDGTTHLDGITAICYNPQHEFIMTCSSEDIFVWECETGKQIAEFNTIGGDGSMHLDTIAEKKEAPMEEENIFIMPKPLLHGREQVDTYEVGTVTCVTLDNMGRRFFTAHANGVIKAWNFYNGRNLYNLYKPLDNNDICDMHYITVNAEHRYLMTVGWDRKVVIYIDNQGPEVVHQLTLPDEPIEFTHEYLGHQDDIWAATFGYPNLIASGDYSGRLIVWNINSGHIVGYLKTNAARDRAYSKDRFITSLIFHTHTVRDKKTIYLVSSGPYHLMHIWRANTTRELNIGSVGWTRPCDLPRDYVTCIKSVPENNLVVCADTWGCVSIWTMEDRLGEQEPTEWFKKSKLNRGKDPTGFRPRPTGLKKLKLESFRPVGSFDVSSKQRPKVVDLTQSSASVSSTREGSGGGSGSGEGKKQSSVGSAEVLSMIETDKSPIYNFNIAEIASNFGINIQSEEIGVKSGSVGYGGGSGQSGGKNQWSKEFTNKPGKQMEKRGGIGVGTQTGSQTQAGMGSGSMNWDVDIPESMLDMEVVPSVSQTRRIKDERKEKERVKTVLGSSDSSTDSSFSTNKARREKKAKGYGLGPVQMKFIRSWKCHVDGFECLEVCNTYGLIVTGSKDRSVRIWDFQGNHIGILGQADEWLVGDPTTYKPMHPHDVILDVKRIRGMEFFRRPPGAPLPSELVADAFVKRMLQQAERPRMTDADISSKAMPYQKLLNYNVPTTVWIQPTAPVGSYKKSIIDTTQAVIPYTEGSVPKKQRKKIDSSEVKRF